MACRVFLALNNRDRGANSPAMKWIYGPLFLIASAGLVAAGYSLARRAPASPISSNAALVVHQLAAQRTLIVGQAVVEARLHLKVPPTRVMGVPLPDDAELLRLVPAVVSYGVDLSVLKSDAIDMGEGRARLRVPDVKIVAIDPSESGVFESKSLGLLRSEAGLGNALEKQASALTRPAIEQRASDPALLNYARAQARAQLAALVKDLGGPATIDVQIEGLDNR
jgi:Protein of unknown function (DUF4230)